MVKGRVRNAYELVVEEMAELRPCLRFLDADVFPCQGPRPKSLIEVSGKSSTGKSMLLQHLVARCVLPTYFNGKYSDAIYVDMGHHFDVEQFIAIGKRLLRTSGEHYSPGEDDHVLHNCLEFVTLLECFKPEQFELALYQIENILWDNNDVCLLVIDNLEAFYWPDARARRVRMRVHYARITERLKKVCDTHNIVCAYSVATNYIELKRRRSAYPMKQPAQINHKLELRLLHSGRRTLNGRPITLHSDGIHFTT